MSSADFVELIKYSQKIIVDTIGATLSDYRKENNDARIMFAYGKDRSKAEVSQGYVLAPFPGRCEKGKYTFEGKEHSMKAPIFLQDGNALHGFVFCEKWDCAVEGDAIVCKYVMKKEEFEPKGLTIFDLIILFAQNLHNYF